MADAFDDSKTIIIIFQANTIIIIFQVILSN